MSVFLNATLDDGPVASASPGAVPMPLPTPTEPDGPASDPFRPIREVEAICAKHNLPCGAPEDLAPFLSALDQNKLLAMNFWSLVARLSDGRHGEPLSQQQVLATIVQGITGRPIEQAEDSQHDQIAQLSRMLAGEDLAPPAAAPHDPDPPPPIEAAPEPNPPVEDAGLFLSQLNRSRLVLVPDPPAAAAPPAEPTAAEAAQPTPARAPMPWNAPRHTPPEHGPDEPALTIPLSSYAEQDDEQRPRRRGAVLVLTLVLLCAAGFLIGFGIAAWRKPGNAAHQGISSALARIGTSIHNAFTTAHQPAPPPSTPETTPETLPAPPAATSPPSALTSAPGITTPPAPVAPATSPAPAAAPTSSAPTQPASSQTPPTPTQRREGSPHTAPAAAENDSVNDAALVQVPGSEMREHLISSRFPIVPDAANADAVSGVVVLHAVITARGAVEHAYAISGPDNLRQPAIDAVSSWRYRPYLLNGAPVDVSTTIRVDFSGND